MRHRFHLPAAAVLVVCGWFDAGPLFAGGDAQPAMVSSRPQSHIVAPKPQYTFRNQKFVYSVQWHFLNAGMSTVEIQHTGSGARVLATADSAGMPDKLFKVHDLFTASLDTMTFCTRHVEKHSEEGKKQYEETVALDYPHGKSRVDVKDVKTAETKHSEFDIPACVTDVISGFFYVASLPLAPGYSEIFPVNDNGKTTDVEVKVESRERVKSPLGHLDTLRVKVEPLSGPMKGKGVLWVWFTDDGRRIPVQMKSKLGFATLLFQLEQISPPPDAR
jgi:hypothetical protein